MKITVLQEAISPNKALWLKTQSKIGPSGVAIDPDTYPPIPGMEGPFFIRGANKVLYYDSKEGSYYDRRTDMYVDSETGAVL